MNIVNGWLLCEYSVVERTLAELGIESEGNIWQPIAIKLSEIVAFNPFMENGGEEDGTAVFLVSGEDFVINVDYEKLLEGFTRPKWVVKCSMCDGKGFHEPTPSTL